MSEIVENGQQQIGPLVDGGEQPLTNGAGNHSTQHDLPAEREVEMIPEVSKQLILVNMTEAVTPKVGFQSEVARITLSPQSGGGGGGGGGEGTDPAADEQHEGAAPEELHLSSSEVVLVKPPSDLIDFDLEAAEETAAVLPRGDQHVTVESKQAINEDVVVPAVTTQEEVVSEVTIDPVEEAPVSTSSMVNAAVQPEEVHPSEVQLQASVPHVPVIEMVTKEAASPPREDSSTLVEKNHIEEIVLASEFVEEEINQRVNITTKENKTNMADVLPAVNWVNFLYFVFAILTAAFLKCVFIDDISLFWILALLSVASVVIFWKLDA